MASKTTIIIPQGGHSPKFINKDTKLIVDWNGKFYRGVETDDFIYFCNYKEGDDNASVKMYRKSDLSLASDNYFAANDLFEVLTEKTYTYLSKSMKYNAREVQKQEA